FLATGFIYLNNHLDPVHEGFAAKQEAAKELVDYNRRLSKNLGVDSRAQVREYLSRFNYEIEVAANEEELSKAILTYASRTQEKILQEYDTRQRETVLVLINQDALVQQIKEEKRLTVKLVRGEGVQTEPANVLSSETLQKIAETVTLGEQAQDLVIEVEIENGSGQLMVPLNAADQISSLNKDLDSLRVTVHDLRSQAGFAEMTGAGVIVKIYDNTDGYTNDAIIHETDVRDTINELFAAGARGVAVGNQRLTVSSAIRCVGPSILVNDERIAVNPVVIQAVGDPDVLASGLDIIRITLQVSRELTLEIEKTDHLTLPAYTR
ncbi:MAG TPA: DUF881 domain-containing protein, partial [Oscillospiraceae bacterium]|nr:DUF881 domain-containing protein [Oscillospiraceae bacterium]